MNDLSPEMQQLISAFAKEMKSSLTEDQINKLIKIQLLENNVLIEQSIAKMGDKVNSTFQATAATFVTQLSSVATNQGSNETRITNVENKVNNLWAKLLGVGAGCATMSGLFVYLIDHLPR